MEEILCPFRKSFRVIEMNPSNKIVSRTDEYFLPCLMEKCAAFKGTYQWCKLIDNENQNKLKLNNE